MSVLAGVFFASLFWGVLINLAVKMSKWNNQMEYCLFIYRLECIETN